MTENANSSNNSLGVLIGGVFVGLLFGAVCYGAISIIFLIFLYGFGQGKEAAYIGTGVVLLIAGWALYSIVWYIKTKEPQPFVMGMLMGIAFILILQVFQFLVITGISLFKN